MPTCCVAEAAHTAAALACSAGVPSSRSRQASCTQLAAQDSRTHTISSRQALQAHTCGHKHTAGSLPGLSVSYRVFF